MLFYFLHLLKELLIDNEKPYTVKTKGIMLSLENSVASKEITKVFLFPYKRVNPQHCLSAPTYGRF